MKGGQRPGEDFGPRREKHGKRGREVRHVRSAALFALFAVIDVALFALCLSLENLLLWAVRPLVGLLFTFAAQPASERQPWSSRQALIALTAVLMPLGGVLAFFWSLRVTKPNGAWTDVPLQQKPYRSPIDWEGVLDVVPLIDVLDSDDAAYKKNVLLQVQTTRSPVEVSVVRRALDDRDPEVRYYAAGLLNHTEASYSNRIRRLEGELEEHSGETEVWNLLAQAYGEIIQSGIAGTELSRFYLEKRFGVLQKSLELQPDQPETGIETAQTLLALGRTSEAETAARRWLDAGGELSDLARGVLVEVAYQERDLYFLRTLALEVEDPAHLPERLQGVVRLVKQGEVAE